MERHNLVFRTRFAPSPTGSLHVGNARAAVLTWLLARHHGGTFVLRIEDTDLERTVAGAEASMAEDLHWLGLDWDEGPAIGGEVERGVHGPYRQTERLPLYRPHAERLLANGQAFRCYCTIEELEARRVAALARGASPHYDGTCRRRTDDEVRRLEAEGRVPAIRFHVPADADASVTDAVRGRIEFAAADIGDFIILRPDGVPTYNFAVVVDDALMEISHVIRGAGHLSNTPRQILIFRALGYPVPVFAHVPDVLGPDRQKLSKRHGAQALAEYRREGFHPDALINYLSLLSWSSASGEEVLDRERLVREISFDRLGVANVVFDAAKLRWLSAKHIERMPLPELVDALEPYLDRERFPLEVDTLPVAVAAVRSHLSTFGQINEQLEPFVPALDQATIEVRAVLAADPGKANLLRTAGEVLEKLEPWDEAGISAALREVGTRAGVKGRALYEPLRLALTGREHGPPLTAVIFVLGKPTTLRLLGGD